ncbi:MAG: rhodanese-like domain-containing protein [Propionibacteriaceae bacterium]|nr:rhodanese-like domain-containing protein [Propionibacteriaceae bacterium]
MQEVTIADLAAARLTGAVVVDVRETDEYVEAHVPGAIHIPLGLLPHRLDEVPDGEPVYVICHSGVRSQYGAQVLAAAGRTALSVAGGTSAWIHARHPVQTGVERG